MDNPTLLRDSDMTRAETDTGAEVVAEIIRSFPTLVPYLREWLERQGYDTDEQRPHPVLERFADATTEAISKKDEVLARGYLALVESFLTSDDQELRALLDVAYCENLMWDLQDKELKHWGYSLFPPEVRRLYTDMWGSP
ncbi:MAG: hypothetical protein REI94_02640 [Moraxellaceae bacterium]|nr:hypothetical protein [Moraxellaceae bacterium]